MPKRTILLIIGLIGLTVVLFVLALSLKEVQPITPEPNGALLSPTPVPHTLLQLTPNPVTISSSLQGKVDVLIDSGGDKVTGVQLEMTYDPKLISNVKIQPASFFQSPMVLLNTIDQKEGKISYALALSPAQPALSGRGTIATITFVQHTLLQTAAQGNQPQTTELKLLPTSLVTTSGQVQSVLKTASGTKINLYTQ